METNIFLASDSDRKAARWRHALTLLAAIVVSYLAWGLMGNTTDQEYDLTFREILFDFATSAVETVILMEISILVCKLVIRIFQDTRYSMFSLLVQNLILLTSDLLSAGAIAYVYRHLFKEDPWLSWDIFLCDSLVAFFITSVLFTSFLTNRYRDEVEETLKAKLQFKEERALALQMSIEKLKLKTDNHFVFNSLATLGNLIESDRDSAIEFNRSMSRMYRYIVTKGDAMTVPINEELNFVMEYAKNIALRYTNVHVTIDPSVRLEGMLIPPLSIQGLIENAIKHNSHTDECPLEIQVLKGNDEIIVLNNLNPLKSTIAATGTGLNTLNDRFLMICKKEIAVLKTQDSFSVHLPLISSNYESSDN